MPNLWRSRAAGLVRIAGVYDPALETAESCRETPESRRRLLEEAAAGSDALSVVTPTVTHFKLAQALLDQGKHVLVEKPMTNSASQAAELVELAQRRHCVLQVGHVERFNPVFKYLEGVATQPRFIEAHRLSP